MAMDGIIVTAAAPAANWAPTIAAGADWGPFPLGNIRLDGVARPIAGVVSAELHVIDSAAKTVLTTGTATVTRETPGDDASDMVGLSLSLTAAQTAAIIPSQCNAARLVVLLVDDAGKRYPLTNAPINLIQAPAPEVVI